MTKKESSCCEELCNHTKQLSKDSTKLQKQSQDLFLFRDELNKTSDELKKLLNIVVWESEVQYLEHKNEDLLPQQMAFAGSNREIKGAVLKRLGFFTAGTIFGIVIGYIIGAALKKNDQEK